MIEGKVTSDFEKEGLGGLDGLLRLGFPDPEIGFLDEVVHVADGGKLTAEPRLELAVVSMDLRVKPLVGGLLRRGGSGNRIRLRDEWALGIHWK